jgi:hypothetical protein
MVGALILVAGLTSGTPILAWTGAILMMAAFVPMGLIRIPALRRRWMADGETRYQSMRFLLFNGPFWGLPLVLVGIVMDQPIWIVIGGGMGLVSVLSAVHVALAPDP